MTPTEIREKFLKDRHKANVNIITNKPYFEIYLCETYEYKGQKYDTKNSYKFHYLEARGDKLILLNKRFKEIKKLTKDNVVWISDIYLKDKNLEILISQFKCATLTTEKGEQENGK